MSSTQRITRINESMLVSKSDQQSALLLDRLLEQERDTLLDSQLSILDSTLESIIEQTLSSSSTSSTLSDTSILMQDYIATLQPMVEATQHELSQLLEAKSSIWRDQSIWYDDSNNDHHDTRESGQRLEKATSDFVTEAKRLNHVWPVELEHWVNAATTRSTTASIPRWGVAIEEAQQRLDKVTKMLMTRQSIRDAHTRIINTLDHTTNDDTDNTGRNQWHSLNGVYQRLEAILAHEDERK
ncbi:hypothetical protein BDF22DRAFT_740749 [Syncephalis plumigaleata]|nr:hypothetical protein BDF22DRAFT_740749 [Syncephalis plumigaleata]